MRPGDLDLRRRQPPSHAPRRRTPASAASGPWTAARAALALELGRQISLRNARRPPAPQRRRGGRRGQVGGGGKSTGTVRPMVAGSRLGRLLNLLIFREGDLRLLILDKGKRIKNYKAIISLTFLTTLGLRTLTNILKHKNTIICYVSHYISVIDYLITYLNFENYTIFN